jgi:TRAP transporter 4TM/12TM fusion protein
LVAVAWALDAFRSTGFNLYPEQLLIAAFACAGAALYLQWPKAGRWQRVIDRIAAVVLLLIGAHVAADYPRIMDEMSGRPTDVTIASIILLILLLEAVRRSAGPALAIILAVFLIYGLLGHLIPGDLQARRTPWDRLAGYTALDPNGMIGLPLSVAVAVVVPFILFGSVLEMSGGASFFTDLAMSLMGRLRGGPAKIAILASSLFGMISGSAVANVASTGVVTIPMMKKAGYPAHTAAAIEAVASTGGQLAPPVMGAAAFLMAEFLKVSYQDVVLAALIPALLYYVVLFAQADLLAARNGISAAPSVTIPRFSVVIASGWPNLVPFSVLLVALFALNMSAGEAALYAVGATVLVGGIIRLRRGPGHGIGWRDLWPALVATGEACIGIVIISAAAGVIIGVLNISSLGFSLSLSLVSLAHGNLPILLVLAGGVSIVLGMGMPTVGVYVLLATLVAPAMIELGVEPIAAHMFVLYFGLMSMITPPVALASFAAASLAESHPIKTSWESMRFGWTAYVVPFVFVYRPALLLDGDVTAIALALLSTIAGVFLWSIAVIGWLRVPLGPARRLFLFIVGTIVLFPYPGALLQVGAGIAGALVLAALIAFNFLPGARNAPLPSQ